MAVNLFFLPFVNWELNIVLDHWPSLLLGLQDTNLWIWIDLVGNSQKFKTSSFVAVLTGERSLFLFLAEAGGICSHSLYTLPTWSFLFLWQRKIREDGRINFKGRALALYLSPRWNMWCVHLAGRSARSVRWGGGLFCSGGMFLFPWSPSPARAVRFFLPWLPPSAHDGDMESPHLHPLMPCSVQA